MMRRSLAFPFLILLLLLLPKARTLHAETRHGSEVTIADGEVIVGLLTLLPAVGGVLSLAAMLLGTGSTAIWLFSKPKPALQLMKAA